MALLGPPDIDELWDYNEPAESEAKFRTLLPQARDPGNEAYLAELLTQIGRAQGLQGKFEEAHATLDEALGLITEKMKRARVRYLLERGRVFNSAGRPAEARPLFRQAWDLGLVSDEDYHTVDAAHMLGIVEPEDSGLVWSLKAMQLAETAGDKKAEKWLPALYNNIGWTYHDAGKYNDALGMFQQALKLREDKKEGGEREIRVARWAVARAKRSLGLVNEALEEQKKLEAEWRDAGGSDGYVDEEIAECLLALGRDAESRSYFARAYSLLKEDPSFAGEQAPRLQRLKELGEAA